MIAANNIKTVILSPNAWGAYNEVIENNRADALYLHIIICPVRQFVPGNVLNIISRYYPEYRTMPNGAELHLWGKLIAASGGAK